MDVLAALGLAFFFGFIGSIPLTGPIALLVFSRSAKRQFRKAVNLGLGAALAEGLYAGGAFWGFRTLVHSDALKRIADAVSAVVLVGLGIYFARWRFHERTPRRADDDRCFWTGFSISLLNPTLLVTWSVVVAALTSRDWLGGNRWHALPFGVGAALGVASWELLFVAGVRRFGDKFHQTLIRRIVRGVAVVLIALGAWSGYQFLHLVHLVG